MKNLLSGPRTSLLAFDDRALLLAQAEKGAFALHRGELTGTSGLAAALQATRRDSGLPLGDVAMMLPLGKSVLVDVTIDANVWTGDAVGVAENSISRSSFKQEAELLVEATDQGKRRGTRHVTAGAIERDVLMLAMNAVEELDGRVVHAFHPAEALAAAVPQAQAIVWLSASYMLFVVATRDTLIAHSEPRSARQQAWLSAVQEQIGKARELLGPDFARQLVLIGDNVETEAAALAKATNAEVYSPTSPSQGTSGALFWLALGLDRCAAKKYARKAVDFASSLTKESEKPAIYGAVGGAIAGGTAAAIASFLLHSTVATHANNVAQIRSQVESMRLDLQAREGHLASDVRSLGDTASQIARARESGKLLAASAEQIGNIAISNGVWMNGKLTVQLGGDPSLAIATRNPSALGAFQLALGRANYNDLWSQLDPHPASNGAYITAQVGVAGK